LRGANIAISSAEATEMGFVVPVCDLPHLFIERAYTTLPDGARKNLQTSRHVSRERRIEEHRHPGRRVDEADRLCMEGLAVYHRQQAFHLGLLLRPTRSPDDVPAIICRVTEYGMMDVRKMDPDLVGSSCPEFQPKQGKVLKLLEDHILGRRSFPGATTAIFFLSDLLRPRFASMSPERSVKRPQTIAWYSRAIVRWANCFARRAWATSFFRRDHDPRSVFVKPVDDAGPGGVVQRRECPAVEEERVDKRSCVVPICRMCHHPCRLLTTTTSPSSYTISSGMSSGRAFCGGGFGSVTWNDLPGRDAMAGTDLFLVDQDGSFTDAALHLRARGVFHVVRQVNVEPFFFLAGRNNNLECVRHERSPGKDNRTDRKANAQGTNVRSVVS